MFLAKAWRMLSYEANINMRSAAKHVMSCGKALPVNQTEEKFNKFQAHNKIESLAMYLFRMLTHQESSPAEHSFKFRKAMHTFLMNAIIINNGTPVTLTQMRTDHIFFKYLTNYHSK